jgi:hypothetical protein
MKIREVYKAILSDMDNATWKNVAVDPEQFVTDRLPRDFVKELREGTGSIVIH